MKRFFLFIPLFILLLSVNIVIFSSDNQKQEQEQGIIENMLQYFLGGSLQVEWFSEKEVLHLEDVRTLVQMSLFLMILFLLASIVGTWHESRAQIRREIFVGGVLGILVTGLLGLTLANFSPSFIAFHEIFFRNDYWLLPADSTLIQLFPESFFIKAVERILLYSGIFSILCIVVGLKIYRKQKWLTQSRCIRRLRAYFAKK